MSQTNLHIAKADPVNKTRRNTNAAISNSREDTLLHADNTQQKSDDRFGWMSENLNIINRIQTKSSQPSRQSIIHPELELSQQDCQSGKKTPNIGTPLPAHTRTFMESRFGADFNDVKIHTDANAVQLNKTLNAQAFTLDHDIYFNSGKFNTETDSGNHLLAHELAHVVQQKHGAHRKIMRAVSVADVETEFQKWAAANTETIIESSENYPHQLWTYISTLILDTNTHKPVEKPPASKKSKLEEWKKKFEKAGIVVKWLIALKAKTQGSSVKTGASSRITGILNLMAEAGLVSDSMTLSTGLDNEEKNYLYKTVLVNPSSASATELETSVTFLCKGVKNPADISVVKTLTNGNSSPLKKLDAALTTAILKPLIQNYGSHTLIVDAIAEILMFNTKIRPTISDSMISGALGNAELLFKVLKHDLLVEPDYGGKTLQALVPKGMSTEDYEKKRMKDDMPWVYKYKQKYYVQYLIELAKSQTIDIPTPASMDFAGLKKWLETNTEKIGEAAFKKYPSDKNSIFEIYKNIADIFFFHIPHNRDVKPNMEGKISHLAAGNPDKKRFEADCDVFATYAMRFFYNAGFEPIGYIVFMPAKTEGVERVGHMAALIKKDKRYYILNNKSILDTSISDGRLIDKRKVAIKKLSKLTFEAVYRTPRPVFLKVYYADAEPKGKMPKLLMDQDSSLEDSDLDPNNL